MQQAPATHAANHDATPQNVIFARFVASLRQSRSSKTQVDPKREKITSLVASDAIIAGDVLFRKGVKIDGQVLGAVTFGVDDGLCVVNSSGVVGGKLTGPKALVLGTVFGDVQISGKLVLGPNAVIKGNIECGVLRIQEGAHISGGTIKTSKTVKKAGVIEISAQSNEVIVDDGEKVKDNKAVNEIQSEEVVEAKELPSPPEEVLVDTPTDHEKQPEPAQDAPPALQVQVEEQKADPVIRRSDPVTSPPAKKRNRSARVVQKKTLEKQYPRKAA